MKINHKNTVQIKDLKRFENKKVSLNGWVMNKRTSKALIFLIMRDGSGFCQCIIAHDKVATEIFEQARHLPLESSVYLEGIAVKDERQIGGYEVHVQNLEVYQLAEEYPIGKKEHGVDFLIDHRHLWLRSRSQWAVMRIRNQITYSIHRFFQENDFVQLDSPIFTGNAVEGTTDLFQTDFFDQPAYLSQSGQLYGEAMAMALGKVYTFGPTFRAEKSKTRRHLSEFWMIEPEMAFCDLDMNMDLIEDFIRFVVNEVLKNCGFELEQLNRDTSMLKNINRPFPRLTYDDAVQILKGEKNVDGQNTLETLEKDLVNAKEAIRNTEKEIEEREVQINRGGMKKGKLNWMQNKVQKLKVTLKELREREKNIPQWIESAKNFRYGDDFGGSDETVLTRLYGVPIMIYHWPREIKAFYMKKVEDNPTLVKGVDVLAPEGYGEIVGGGERETGKDELVRSIKEHNLPVEAFQWYLDLRRYGSVPHSGFGLGLERFISWICKLTHLRESIPFPRMMGRLFP